MYYICGFITLNAADIYYVCGFITFVGIITLAGVTIICFLLIRTSILVVYYIMHQLLNFLKKKSATAAFCNN